jgi:hypothetical protein
MDHWLSLYVRSVSDMKSPIRLAAFAALLLGLCSTDMSAGLNPNKLVGQEVWFVVKDGKVIEEYGLI